VRSRLQVFARHRPARGGFADLHPDLLLVRRAALRMGFTVALAVAIVVAVSSVAVLLVLLHDQRAAASTVLADTVARADDVGDPPSGMWLAIRSGQGTAVTPGEPSGLPLRAALDRVSRTGGVDVRDVSLDGARFRVRTEAVHGVVVQAMLDLASDRAQSGSVMRTLVVFGGVGLLLAGLAGIWVGRRAVGPLATALALQRTFVADASHELRTPVTLLHTRAQLIQRRLRTGLTDATLSREIDGLVEDSRRLNAILEDLLLSVDQRSEPPTAVDLVELTAQVAGSAASYAHEQGVDISTAPGSAVQVLGSAVALRRAITALADNAIRHASSSVSLCARVAGRSAIVDVRDDGPGLEVGGQPLHFRRFAPGPANATDGRRHYGLGLALVNDIVSRHHGNVAAVAVDHGTLIRITLPATPSPAPAACPAQRDGRDE
jgi:signal transduction histidine kinase